MLDVSGFFLQKILLNPESGLEYWPKVKLIYFDPAYSSIVSSIGKFYNKYNKLPSFEDLDTFIRTGHIKDNLQSLKNLEPPADIDLEILFDALVDNYTQKEALIKIDNYLDNITMMSCEEIKENLVDIAVYLEEKTQSSEHIITMSDINVVDRKEILSRVPLGLNNTFDAHLGGAALSELILIGGKKGSGKSVIGVNVGINQYLMGNTCPIFSIEMRGREIYNRIISAMAGVSNTKIRKGELEDQDYIKIAKVRADMFLDGEKAYNEYLKHRNFEEFETSLVKDHKLKPENQLIIIDNQQLSLADIDFNLQKLKSQFGDKLKVAVVDYVNQVQIDDIYKWESQINLAKGLKNLARKYNIVMVSPYQINDEGEARFSRGLLDAADLALTIEQRENAIEFKTKRIRNASKLDFASVCNWDTLRINPIDAVIIEEDNKKTKKIKKSNEDL